MKNKKEIFDAKTINKILGVNDSFRAADKMMSILSDEGSRRFIFNRFLQIENKLDDDWFRKYFETEQAERKKKKQDSTPKSVITVLNQLMGNNGSSYYEPCAGTGGILIGKWYNNLVNDPVGMEILRRKGIAPTLSILTYTPRNYWYVAEEKSDRAFPFLLFNMAIRGMNGVAIQCDSLTRQAKRAYFVRNDTDNALAFSEIFELPKNGMVAKELNISEWVDDFDLD